jgi:hypothetical protein
LLREISRLDPADSRPPLCLSYVGGTVLSMRALQLYPPKTGNKTYQKAVQLAATWQALSRKSVDFRRGQRLGRDGACSCIAGIVTPEGASARRRSPPGRALATQWLHPATIQNVGHGRGQNS